MAQNEFVKMRELVQEAVNNYDTILEKCGINKDDLGSSHYATIHRLAKPFINGHFSLAVVGKMSSGKSTFINALIGKNILPTGHFQTTSTITYIEGGAKLEMKVIYCDGHEEVFTKGISEKLKSLVAIPKEYDGLPINDINKLIARGDCEADILSKKDGIEEKTKYTKLDDSIWRKYIREHKKEDIAKEVYITCPLPEEFEGWRIVDTPGVGAVGGIQDETKQLFFDKDDDGNRKIDAIVFLHSGTDNIEDETARDFMDNLSKELTDEAKKRLFFILTKASAEVFRQHKEDILTKAKSIYAEKFNIPQERFNYVDSLLCRFRKDLEHTDKKNFDEIKELDGWDKDDWDVMTNLYTPIKKAISSKGFEFNNESIDKIMKKWANFEQIKSLLNSFARKEKEQSLTDIKEHISKDCEVLKKAFQQRIGLLEGGRKRIKEEENRHDKKQVELNNILTDLKQVSFEELWGNFEFVYKEIDEFSKKSMSEITTSFQNLIDKISQTERDIFESLKNEFKSYRDKYSLDDIALSIIDLDELVKVAERFDEFKSEAIKENTGPAKEPNLFIRILRKILKLKPIEKTDSVNATKDFSEKVQNEAREAVKSHKEKLKKKVNNYYELLKNILEQREQAERRLLEELVEKLGNSDDEINKLNNNITMIKDLTKRI